MTVKLYLIGLIAIWSSEGAITVLVRDVPQQDVIDGVCVEPHIPILWWDAKCDGDGCDSNRERDFPRCDPHADKHVEEDGFWLLNGEELTLSGSFTGRQRPARRRLAQMSRLVDKRDSGRFNEGLLQAPEGLVAHWRLEGVSAQGCHLVKIPQGVAVMEFRRGREGRWNAPVADIALVEFTVPRADLPLELTATSRNGATRTLELRPPKEGRPITLVLSNQTPRLDKRPLIGLHFEYLYRFSKRWPDRRDRRRVPQVAGYDPLRGEYVNACSVGATDPILEQLVDGYTPGLLADEVETLSHIRSLGNRPMCPLGEF